ncbi:Wadjet anti-phage system protein JetD domain-containing protein [Paenibacillus sp. BJ-4]|uniref:Wadjet anti-phage system protein JetD domain-containing protein n=1 Tax=Paenibacillus sp. BJ-4 TaxID=2878097 RepID=UPI001CF0559B|nr:Wadjet anti-phage system protein JetD domain-containing protein [Paenibacillus sp. BJ-4]
MESEDIRRQLLSHIQSYKKSTILLEELAAFMSGHDVNYPSFAETILQLEEMQILVGVKAHGRNGKRPALAYQYKIRRVFMRQGHLQRIQQHSAQFHPSINLDWYYGQSEDTWNKDLTYIERIHHFLAMHGLPVSEVPAPERSYQLTGDEKWITDGGGRVVLERLGLWSKMLIKPVSDPLMWAFNPSLETSQSYQSHLIIENKTTFQALLTGLSTLPFSTLIFGSGWKIVGNLEMFHLQYPVQDVQHTFYYFGDLDWEGIRIWHALQVKHMVKLAVEFYLACLEHKGVPGKLNQIRSEADLATCRTVLPEAAGEQLENMLRNGQYIPQEVLGREQLLAIGRLGV